jgi:uncharacterized protein YneF (UPF0154 family)
MAGLDSDAGSLRLVRPNSSEDVMRLVVRHDFPAWALIVVAIIMLSLGIICGVVIAQSSAIRELKDSVKLNEVWIRTHRHEHVGAQPHIPEEN